MATMRARCRRASLLLLGAASALLLAACPNLLAPADADEPVNLTASHSAYATHIALAWDAASGATAYVVYRAETHDASAVYAKIGEAAKPAYEDRTAEPGRNYWYKVAARGSSRKESRMSAPAYGSRRGSGGAVAIPYGLSASEGDYGKIRLSWQEDSSAGGVAIYRGTKADGSDRALLFTAGGGGGMAVDDDQLLDPKFLENSLAGKIFYYWAMGVSKADPKVLSSPSLPDTGYAFGGQASRPANLRASQGSLARRVSLSWDRVEGASGYRLLRADYPEGPYRLIGRDVVHAALSTEDDTALPGRRYCYAVQAFANFPAATYSSDRSDSVVGYAEINAALLPPDNLRTARASRYAVRLAWDEKPGAAGYRIYRSASATGVFACLAEGPTASYTDYGLAASTPYHYRVSAYDAAGEGDYGPVLSVTTAAVSTLAAPPAPTAVPGPARTTSLALSWTPTAEASGYRVYRADSAAGPFAAIGETDQASYLDAGLAMDATYRYRVSAFNELDDSPPSDSKDARTDPPVPEAPAELSAVKNDTDDINLSFSNTPYAVSYRVYRKKENEAESTWAKVGEPAFDPSTRAYYSYADPWEGGLKRGVYYEYRVSAVNRLGEEGPKSPLAVGNIIAWPFATPILRFQGSENHRVLPNPPNAPFVTFDWAPDADPRVQGYRIFRARMSLVNSRWTYGPYDMEVDIAANARNQVFLESERGQAFSYIVAANYVQNGDSNGLGPRSRPLDIIAGKDLELSISRLATDPPTAGMVYGGAQNSVRYRFWKPKGLGLVIYLTRYETIESHSAVLSAYREDGSLFEEYGTLAKIEKKPATSTAYITYDSHPIDPAYEGLVILEVGVAGSDPSQQASARFAIEVTDEYISHQRAW